MSKQITIDPDICNGKPIISGTRITVQTIFGFLAAGDSIDELLENYPALSRSDVEAAFDYASRLTGNRILVEAIS